MALTVLTTRPPLLSRPSRPRSHSDSLRVAKGRRQNESWVTLSSLRPNRTDPDLSSDGFDGPDDAVSDDIWRALDNIAALRLSVENEEELARPSTDLPTISVGHDEVNITEEQGEPTLSAAAWPFHKWMKNLHRRARRANEEIPDTEPFPGYSFENYAVGNNIHRKSSSGSSFGFVAAVKSATVSLASASVRTRRRRRGTQTSLHTRTDYSSRGSISGHRISEDSAYFERIPYIDPAVTERLLQRRRILEELITTEECYIGDIRFLMNVYVTILASMPTLHHGLRSSINQNLTDIIELHEDILGDLHRIVPYSEYTQPEHVVVDPNPLPRGGHHRWHSLDSVPEGKGNSSWLQSVPSVAAEPNIAAEVAQIFGEKMNRFLVYEEYGARYELMIKDVASAHRTLPEWDSYQKGIEALAASLSAANHNLGNHRKSLTIGDLLVKPIQRICRYPLLFSELLKYTPVCDCPNSHMEIESVLMRLREVTAEINRATDDPQMKTTLEQTWLLQDRLIFPHQSNSAASKTTIRSFGHVRLCGALHVCWQTRDGVAGQYMISLLYRECLCLATASKGDQVYAIQACISLDSIKIEEADNGRGLQCHTAPFSWKLVFECDHQLYEILMTACSQKEAAEWRTRLSQIKPTRSHNQADQTFYSSISLRIKSLGTVFRKPGSVARRLSIHRATTIGPKSPLCQVILKNMSTAKDISSENLSSPINRSQSLLTTNSRVPVIVPSRAERTRLEVLLADVWSRKDLPFPGTTTRSRSEHLVRTSASTMMRKLSAASLTHRFARRSASAANLAQAEVMEDDGQLPHVNDFLDSMVRLNCNALPSGITGAIESNQPQRLPMIRDEMERSSSNNSSGLQGIDGFTPNGTVRRLDMAKVQAIWGSEKGLNESSRRATPRLSDYPETASSNCSMEAHQACHGLDSVNSSRECLTPTRSTSRWARVGALNRSLMASSRSFFH
ncbi:Dbl homology domain-containing protein [Poronia punctata]|nr:Dbl homology domain-containing protein [Poronia punctata]